MRLIANLLIHVLLGIISKVSTKSLVVCKSGRDPAIDRTPGTPGFGKYMLENTLNGDWSFDHCVPQVSGLSATQCGFCLWSVKCTVDKVLSCGALLCHSIAGQILTLGPKFPAGRPVPTIMMAPDSGGVIDLPIGKLGVDFKM